MQLVKRIPGSSASQSVFKTWLIISFLFTSALLAGCLESTTSRPSAQAPADQRELVLRVQRMLSQQGLDPGTIDGIEGPNTRSALERFQSDRGLPKTGSVNKIAFNQLTSETRAAAKQMRDDSSYVDNSYIEGCGVGAITGIAIAIITGENTKDRKKKALQYGGAACVLALGANYWLQHKREGAAYNEAEQKEMLATLKEENVKLGSLISSSRAVVAEDKNKIKQIDTAYRNKQISLQDAELQMAEVDDNKAHLEKTLAKLEEREENWKSLGTELSANSSSSETVAMDFEIASLEKKIGVLKSELRSLEQTRSISSIG